MTLTWQMHCGDALSVLQLLPAASVDLVLTSPPYWGLRAYEGADGQWGQETTFREYVARQVTLGRELRRVLKDSGVYRLNLGDCYASAPVGTFNGGGFKDASARAGTRDMSGIATSGGFDKSEASGLPYKNLLMMPHRVAIALQEDGWYVRQDDIWAKPNPMRESAPDRTTRAHEFVFHLTKSPDYFFDIDAIRTTLAPSTLLQAKAEYFGEDTKDYDANDVQRPGDIKARIVKRMRDKQRGHSRRHAGFNDRWDSLSREDQMAGGARCTTVWWIGTEPSEFDHFAVMPRRLARRCIKSGCPVGGVVLDCFAGTGTSGVVALEEGRSFIGIELSPKYHEIARTRLASVCPLLSQEIPA